MENVAAIIKNHYEEVEDEDEAHTEKVKMPKTIAITSFGPTDSQRAMPYIIEDGSTPDWSENFYSLKLSKVVVPSVPNITELSLSNSQMRTEDITKVLTTIRKDPDSMTQQKTNIEESEAYKVACQMDASTKTHLKEVKDPNRENVDTDLDNPQKTHVTDRRGTTDDAETLADSAYQQVKYETYQEGDVNKTYPEKTAAPSNITNDGPPNNGCQDRR